MGQSAEDRVKAEAIVSGWFWQPAEGHNYRYKFAIKSLTRFYESAPMQPDEIKIVLEYLKDQEIGNAGISLLNKTVDLGTGWKAKDAWYQTQPSEKWANTESTKIRIFQILIQPSAEGLNGDGPYLVENGCQYKISHTFYWDVETLPNLPASSSGFAVTMQGVSRDRETGLFSCVIETKERIQQDVAEYTTATNAFQTVKDEQHIGVKQANVGTTGRAASVSSGTIIQRKITKNADCTSNVENTTVVEKPVAGATIEFRKTLRGTTSRTLNRSQNQAVNSSGMKVGETRRSEKTEGELWNNEVQVTTNEPTGLLADSCTRNSVTHADAETENVATKPTVEQTDPGVNREVRKEARRTENDTWDVSTTTIVYKPKSTGAMTHGSSTVRTETRVGINQTSTPASGQGGVNVVRRISASPNEHGSFSTSEEITTYSPDSKTATSGTTSRQETITSGINQTSVPTAAPAINRQEDVSISINDHGSMSTQKRTIVYNPEERTATGGTTSRQETVTSGINQTSVPTAAPAINRQEDVSISINDHGSMSTQKRTIVYNPESKTATGGTTSRRETVVTGINQTSVPTAAPAINRQEDVSISINDHGSVSTQKRTVEYEPTRSSTRLWSDKNFDYGIEVYNNQTSPLLPPANQDSATASFQLNDHGSYNGVRSWRNARENLTAGETLAFHYGPIDVQATILYMKKGIMHKLVVKAKCERYYGILRNVQKKTAEGESFPMAGWTSSCHAMGVNMAHGVKYTEMTIDEDEPITVEADSSSNNS